MADETVLEKGEEESTREKPEIKFFSKENVNYLLTELAERIKNSHTGE